MIAIVIVHVLIVVKSVCMHYYLILSGKPFTKFCKNEIQNRQIKVYMQFVIQMSNWCFGQKLISNALLKLPRHLAASLRSRCITIATEGNVRTSKCCVHIFNHGTCPTVLLFTLIIFSCLLPVTWAPTMQLQQQLYLIPLSANYILTVTLSISAHCTTHSLTAALDQRGP